MENKEIALKFILEKRGWTQSRLAKDMNISKQSVTRWVKQKKPIHDSYIRYIEENLKVKRRFFVDGRRYCKLLTDEDKFELEDYFMRQEFEQPTSTASKHKYYNNLDNLSKTELIHREQQHEAYMLAFREKKAESKIQKLTTKIKENIKNIDIKSGVDSTSGYLDLLESNIVFYERLLHLRKGKQITEQEWEYIFKALFMLTSKESNIQTDEVSSGIFNILKENRNRIEQKRQEDIEFYKEYFGEIPEENTEEV